MEGDWYEECGPVDAETYISRCPASRHVLETDLPFFWTKNRSDGQETYRVCLHPIGPGLHGLQVPVFGHAGLVGAMSYGGRSIDSSTEVRVALTALAEAAFHAAWRHEQLDAVSSAPDLSERELEVMRWVASGRRQADIARELGLSERTVEKHLRRIRGRLGVTSTAQAVHRLVQSGTLDSGAI